MLEYYGPDRIQTIKKAENYQDLLAIAMDVLDEMSNDQVSKPIYQVCGPISTGGTGSRNKNLIIFSKVIKKLTEDGWSIFNQMPFESTMLRIFTSRPELGGATLLEEFYKPIFRSGYISGFFFIHSWEGSNGCNWENKQAKVLGIPRLYLAQSYMLD